MTTSRPSHVASSAAAGVTLCAPAPVAYSSSLPDLIPDSSSTQRSESEELLGQDDFGLAYSNGEFDVTHATNHATGDDEGFDDTELLSRLFAGESP